MGLRRRFGTSAGADPVSAVPGTQGYQEGIIFEVFAAAVIGGEATAE